MFALKLIKMCYDLSRCRDKPLFCCAILLMVVIHCELTTGSVPYMMEDHDDVTECEKLNTQEPNCKDRDCFEKCNGSSKVFCFATWTNGTDGVIEYAMKGCWTTDENCVSKSECIQSPLIKNINFCCCSEPRCNMNVKSVYYPSTPLPSTVAVTVTEKSVKENHLSRTLVFSLVPLIGLTAIIILSFWLWKCFKHQSHEYQICLPTVDPIYLMPPSTSLLPLKLIEVRARGRFGAVWKAQLHEEFVAVKIFPLQDKQSWMNEQEIYMLLHMHNNNSILRFIGTDRRGENLNLELWLVTEFQQNGSLYDYLKGKTISWCELCKLAESIARGLSFLHDETPPCNGLPLKPAIAHRDFKSKNVLIKADLSACISDFGLAMKFEPGKNLGETHGLVGTRRYMAPEVLEGAIGFNRDAFLRIDMYAFGLVLWELMSRCTVADGPIADYQLPFEEEVGLHPTLEDMQELVVINKVRPAVREHWLRHAGLEALVSTIEECWDHDAEARISAECVLERVLQLSRALNTSTLSNSNSIVNCPPPLIININQGLPPVSPVVLQTL